jgi:hypothetical protein
MDSKSGFSYSLLPEEIAFNISVSRNRILERNINSKVKRKSGKWKCLAKTLARFDVHLRLPEAKLLFVSNV